MSKAVIAVDFDGVLSTYSGDPTRPPGPPVPGALEFIEDALKRGAGVVVFSSRSRDDIEKWLDRHGFPAMPVFYKPPVVAVIDDRAVRFTGDFRGLWKKAWESPWWKQ